MTLRSRCQVHGKLCVPLESGTLAQLVRIGITHNGPVKLGNQEGVRRQDVVRARLKGFTRGDVLLERDGRLDVRCIDIQNGVGIRAGCKANNGGGHEKRLLIASG